MADAPFYLQDPDPIQKLGLANYLQMQAVAVPPDQAQINNAVLNQPVPQRAPAQAADPRALKALQKYLPPKPMAAPASNDQIAAYTGLSEKSLADQQATLSGLNQYIDSIAAKPQGLNLTPLAGFIDSFTGSKLSPAAQALAPQSADDRDKMLFGLRNQLATGQEKLSNDRLQATQYAQTMQRQMAHDAEQARHNSALEQIGLARGDGMTQRAQSKKDDQVNALANVWDKDPQILKTIGQRNQVALDRHTLETAEVITPQMINEVSKGLANAFNGGKSSGLEESKKQEIKSAEGDWLSLQQYIQNKPFHALSDENKAQFISVFTRLENGYGNVIKARAMQLGRGRDFKFNPALADTKAAKIADYSSFADGGEQSNNGSKASPHNEAVDWARANPTDPRAAAILKMNGM